MGLRSALVDRARVVTREATAKKVSGTSQFERVEGPWFTCRLGVEGPAEEGVDAGRVRTPETPILLYWLTAEDGSAVELEADDVVEVVSNQEGTHDWQLSTKPLIIRKKVVLLGAGYANVKKVFEP